MRVTGSFLMGLDWSKIYEDWMEIDNFKKFNESNGLEQCPWCGRDFYEQMDPVVQEDGEVFEDYYESDPQKKHYHTECWRRRSLVKYGQEVKPLSEF